MTASRRSRTAYPYHHALGTRWADNDVYGHVNNVVYYSYFDTAVNAFLIHAGVLNPQAGDVIGLVVETGCQYFAPLSFPERLTAGLGVERLGNSSVRYAVGIFREGEDTPAAQGHFVHVYVDSGMRRPVSLPRPLRAVLESILLP
ncbi:thioesterase family protein [Deinococcus radiomollis]|uniref:acyl-CoA thioesterase n=1 Tax=Deinococcus radiomollis TaxID=468916 RepID=UPI00389234AC